ncbi:MAG TPA: hypothetical protein VM115_14315 [Vicinamibacterales bacterium]|nr:hypothetical protein [Vicinamibacterales bacterium]
MRLRDCQCDQAECPECGPLVLLAQQIRDEFAHTTHTARVPTPEIIWWRSQMRARQEAARKAARPILFTQALAIAALIGLLVSVAGRLTLPALSLGIMPALSVSMPLLYLVIAAASCLLIAPLLVYLALARD